jgi:hypothetical protein
MPYIGKQPTVGNFQVCDAISVVNGQAAYTMQVNSTNVEPETAFHMLVSLNGVLQKPGSSFTISGSTITFASNLATGDVIDFIILLGDVLNIGTPSDDTITAAKLNNTMISGLTALTSAPADTDEFIISDAGTLKRIDASLVGGKDFELLATNELSSDASNVTFDDLFTSDFKIYKFFIHSLEPNTEAARLNMLYRQGGSDVTDAHYHYLIGADILYGSDSGSTTNQEKDVHGSKIVLTSEMKKTGNYTNSVELTLFNPLGTDRYKACIWHNQNFGSVLTDLSRNYIGAAIYDNNTTALSGIKFLMDSGDIDSGAVFKMYGLK